MRSVNGPLFTVLSGDGVYGYDNHVVWIRDTAGGAVLDGFSITNGYSWDGGGVQYDANCTIRSCIVSGNRANEDGGGISSHAGPVSGVGRIINCAVAGNLCARWGGGVHTENGTMILENCTITGNRTSGGGADDSGGAYQYIGSLIATNTILYNNQGAVGFENYRGVTCGYCCATPLPSGTGNTNANPVFVSAGVGYGLSFSNANLHLGAASPCIDAGTSNTVLTDIEGSVRPTDGNGDGTNQWDMGAYESPTFGSGPLSVSITQDRTTGFPPLPVVFSVTSVAGSNTNGLNFQWVFGDGHTNSGPSVRVVTNQYALGTFLPVLTVTNNTGEVANSPGLTITVVPSDVYVSTNGSHTSPFETWAKAATNIQAAIDVSGASGTNFATVIHVTNGTYDVQAPNYYINFNKAVTLVSVNGPTRTTLRGAGTIGTDRHVVWIRSGCAGAVIRGFTITNGYSDWDGGGIQYDSDCTIQDCIIVGNRANEDGGGISSHENLSLTSIGKICNCLIVGNECVRWGGGLHTESAGSKHVIENCTITRNKAGTDGGGLYVYQGSMGVTNSIVYENRGGSTTTNYGAFGGGGITFAYTCATPVPAGAGNIGANPMFIDAGGGYGAGFTNGNFRLATGSPCIDTGTNGCVNTLTDLDGKARIGRNPVDMGAYEVQPPAGTAFRVR